MNKRTADSIDSATDILTELKPVYDVSPSGTFDPPHTLIPKNQLYQFKALLDHLYDALVNLYTDDPIEREQIGRYLTVIVDLQDACDDLTTEYESLYGFFRNQLSPMVTEIVGFCKDSSTEIPTS